MTLLYKATESWWGMDDFVVHINELLAMLEQNILKYD